MRATLRQNRKLAAWLGLCAAMMAVSIGLVAYSIYQAVDQQKQVDRRICRAFNKFDGLVSAQIRRTAVNLPKLTYYRAHPAELASQEAEIRRELAQFRQHPC